MALIQFETTIHKLEHLAGYYLAIPAHIVQQTGGLNTRLICHVNGSLSWQCGMVAHGNGSAYISIAAPKMKKLKLKEGDSVHMAMEPDTSEFGVNMPEEFAELLEQDVEGSKRFYGLAAGKQRYILSYLDKIKSRQLRVERAVRILQNLKILKEGKEKFADFMNFK